MLVAASNPAALRRGEFLLVLGEMHLAANFLEKHLYLAEHPDPEQALLALERDFPDGRVSPVSPREFTLRGDGCPLSHHPRDISFEVDDTPGWRPRAQIVASGELVVVREGADLVVRTRDRRRQWDILAFFDFPISISQVTRRPSILPCAPHTPRVTIDELVVCRESWCFAAEAAGFARAASPLDRFLEARRWVRREGFPRFVFARMSSELKPYYVDFESPIYVENLAKAVRRSTTVTLTEMLPGPDQCWLRDAAGQRYTGEFRLVAVDPLRWQSPVAEAPPGRRM